MESMRRTLVGTRNLQRYHDMKNIMPQTLTNSVIYFPNQRCHHSFLIISTISRKHEARVQGQLDAPSAHSSFSHRLLIARIISPFTTSPTSPTEEPPTNVSCSATTHRLPSSMDRRNKMHTDVRSSLWKFMISMRGR